MEAKCVAIQAGWKVPTRSSHTGGYEAPRLGWLKVQGASKGAGEQGQHWEQPAPGAKASQCPEMRELWWGSLGSVLKLLTADGTSVQGWGWPGQRLDVPEPTWVDAGKGEYSLCPGEISDQRTDRRDSGWGPREQPPLLFWCPGGGGAQTEPQTPTPHDSSPKSYVFLVFT